MGGKEVTLRGLHVVKAGGPLALITPTACRAEAHFGSTTAASKSFFASPISGHAPSSRSAWRRKQYAVAAARGGLDTSTRTLLLLTRPVSWLNFIRRIICPACSSRETLCSSRRTPSDIDPLA